MITIRRYLTRSGGIPVTEWLDGLRDRKAKTAIMARIFRLEQGIEGDFKKLGGGLSELRVFVGPGYRVYYAKEGSTFVLLLCGGDKSTQNTDIERARRYLADWREREGD
ncbi:type II toxin-antitoxin system RelE/ParE family toxin [Rhodomicrobium sp. Az07]|uniref:type II toxin-antitoxin system RelE/ParE family toxin n=1 Tax=Rhodomicrobium sp. Az07 TaxID=2839034 RepID=UPI001BEBA2F2|nr:type II toxin-antitoxin system RelE/ParE family toxin [Rhodomicrobium sp. Az07]MBT3069458.1 type II toxin-antitoxin system RelE/ParE family toxin [Rhodomicrobium sp. Az07]